MDNRPVLDDLVANVLAELMRLQYSDGSRAGYRRFYQRVLAYARVHDIREYSEAFARRFFEDTFEVTMEALPQPAPQKFCLALRYLRCLGDYQLHGTVFRRQVKKAPYRAPDAYRTVLDVFARECDRRGYSPQGDRTRWHRIRVFVDYLATQGIGPEAISARHLSNYTATLMGCHPKTVAAMLTHVRTFLRFLYHVFRRWPAAVGGISGDRGRGSSRGVKGPAADRGVVDGRRFARAQPGDPQGPVERSGAGLPAGQGQWPPRGERAPPCRAASPPVPWALALRSRGIGRHRRHGPHAMTTERSRCAAVVRHARPWPAPPTR